MNVNNVNNEDAAMENLVGGLESNVERLEKLSNLVGIKEKQRLEQVMKTLSNLMKNSTNL